MRPGLRLSAAVLAALLVLLGGCARAVTRVRPNPAEVAASEYDRMFEAARHVLRDRGFVLDRQDYRFGTLTTRPLTSPTALEPWRGSNTTPYQSLASTLNAQRRLARVTLEPVQKELAGDGSARAPHAAAPRPGASRYLLRVEVLLEQLQYPLRRLSGSTSGGRIYDNLAALPAEYRQRGMPAAYWLAVGRDPYLEQRILQDTLRRSVRTR